MLYILIAKKFITAFSLGGFWNFLGIRMQEVTS